MVLKIHAKCSKTSKQPVQTFAVNDEDCCKAKSCMGCSAVSAVSAAQCSEYSAVSAAQCSERCCSAVSALHASMHLLDKYEPLILNLVFARHHVQAVLFVSANHFVMTLGLGKNGIF